MTEAEDSINSCSVNKIQSLKYLASTVEFFHGNSLLHLIVLDDSFTDNSIGERCLNAVLLSISGASVNELNDDGYSALHLAVLKENVLMVKMLLSCVRNIDVDLKSDCGKGKNAALHLAVNLGNLSIVGELLNKGVHVNFKNGRGIPPLQLAIASRNLEIVKFLIEKDAILYIHDIEFHSFLYAIEFYNADIFKELLHKISCVFPNFDFNIVVRLAAFYGNADVVQILVDRGCDVNYLSNRLVPVLHLAVQSGDFKTIESLIRNEANVSALYENRKSVLHIAEEHCDFATFKFLFDQCTHAIKNDPSLLHQAVTSGNLSVVEFLLNKNTDVNKIDKFNCLLLHHAVESGNLSVIKLLLSKGAILNDENKDFPLLCLAARSGDLAVVEFILDQCPDVNVQDKYGNTPLYYAVFENSVEVIAALLDRGSNLETMNTDRNLLHTAVLCEKIDAAQMLLERGCKVNAKDDRGYTPIMHALENKVMFDSDMVNLLIKWGAVIERSPKGNTALHYACLMPIFKPDIFNSLLNGPANACSTNIRGATPLHFAAKSNNVGALRLLLQKGADRNAKDVKGDTPLHYAARRGNVKFVKALLKRRAEVDVRGLHGRTPLHLAVTHCDDDVVKALQDSGADENIVDDLGKTACYYAELLDQDQTDTEDEYESETDTEDEYESDGGHEDETLESS